ncbi:Rv1733c family protein [Streptomyces luteireticuli]|uniref:Uncharacterized protein n=1 Tax=Streptomyces luteireticuli TaxID=173858 RepID=A0ABN0YM53_9ACTN
MGATSWVRRSTWRWRRNPLRRPTDVLESWVWAAAVVVMLAAGSLAGWLTGSAAHAALRQTVREQALHRHLVSATALRTAGRGTGADREATTGREGYHRVLARWPSPDGTWRTGLVPLPAAAVPGHRFPLWTDDHGRLAGRPLDAATASVHAALAGAAAAAAAAGAVQGLRVLAVRRIMRWRHGQWDRAWERAGQTWGRADAGN